LSSSYGTVELLETHPNAGRTLGQNQNGPSISPQDYISYQPSFRLTSVLSQTIDNAGTLTISSADTNNPAKTSYGSPQYITIKLVPTTTPPSNQAPTITNATATSPTEIKVDWHNPQFYPGGVGIYKKLNSEINWPQQPAQSFSSSTPEAQPGDHTATITGLTPNTTYNIKVRGWLKEQ